MQIESKIKRSGGTRVTLGTTHYHFTKQPDDAHVADVEIEAHIERFLSIPEGFRLYRKDQAAAKVEVVVPTPVAVMPAAPAKSLGFPDQFTIGGIVHSLSDVTLMAQLESGLDTDNWNDLEDDERAAKIEAELDKLQDAADAVIADVRDTDGDGQVSEAEERAALVREHEARFGSKPHHKWNVAKIRKVLGK